MTNSSELDELVNSLINGTMTPDQHRQLEQLLMNHPQAQADYFSRIDLHLALSRLSAQKPDRDPLADTLVRELAPKVLRPAGQNRLLWPTAIAAASIAVLAAAVPFWPKAPQGQVVEVLEPVILAPPQEAPAAPVPKPAQPVVRLLHAAGAELVRELVPKLGTPLQVEHEYVLVKGMMELEFGTGATAILQSPAVFIVNSADRMELKIGNCSVYAPDGAQGFEVITPRSRVVDLGTRFSVNVNDAGNSDVQVVEGAAEVHLKADEASVTTLVKGEASRAASPSEGVQAIQFNPGQYQRSLPDRVVSYEAEIFEGGPGVRDLASVTVQRGGTLHTYPVEQLIGIDILHFAAFSNPNSVASDEELPLHVEDLLTRDHALNTGLINFDRNVKESVNSPSVATDFRKRPGMAVQFQQPVKNDAGPDVVLFEVQSVVYPPEGDHFRVSPLQPDKGLHAHLIAKFDITLNTENAREVAPFRVFTFQSPAKSLEDLVNATSRKGGVMSLPFYALAVGIDLSDLGYADGAEVPGLFFEDANHNTTIVLDPVFIGGFPPIEIPRTGHAADLK